MVLRSIVFYLGNVKQEAIELAKNISGYVDVENGEKDNPHIFMDPFHFVVILVDTSQSRSEICLKKLCKKYGASFANKKVFIYLLKNENKKREMNFQIDYVDEIKSMNIKETSFSWKKIAKYIVNKESNKKIENLK